MANSNNSKSTKPTPSTPAELRAAAITAIDECWRVNNKVFHESYSLDSVVTVLLNLTAVIKYTQQPSDTDLADIRTCILRNHISNLIKSYIDSK